MTKRKKKAQTTGTSFNSVAKSEVIHRKFILHDSSTVTSSGAGTISANLLSLNPSSTQDWGKISAYYDEFRVIGVKLSLLSYQQFSVTKLNDMLVVYFDNDSSTVDAYATALQRVHKAVLCSVFTHPAGKLWTRTFRRPTDKDSPIPWCDVATPSQSLGAISMSSQVGTLSTATLYFTWYAEYLIEARGAR